MKKLVVILAIFAAAAACGGAGAGSSGANGPAPLSKQQSLTQGAQQPAKSTGGGQTAGGTGTTTNPSNPNDLVPALQGPPVIRQAQLAVSVSSGSFDSKLSEVRTLVESEGGYIAGTDAQSSSPTDSQIRTGTINFMVPAANFDATIDALAKVGTLQSEHITGTDVSAQYVDLNARLANAEAQRDAMLALLTQAKTVSDIINVQNQIGQITGEIEQLKGQIKYLNDNTSYSTVTVTLTEAGAPAQSAPSDSWGFATALSAAAHNFVATINYVITGLGAIGPILVLVAVGYLIWRRRRPPVPRHA
jgi:uncharacterized protein DUF4349